MSIPKGYVPVRSVDQNAQWNDQDRTIKMQSGRTLQPNDYVLEGNTAYFNPKLPEHTMHTRTLDPNAQWNTADKTIDTQYGTLQPHMYSLTPDGKSYIDPSTYLSMMNQHFQQDAQLTQEKFDNYYGVAKDIYQPLQNESQARLERLLTSASSQLEAKLGTLDASANRAVLGYKDAENQALKAAQESAIARGIHTSGAAQQTENELRGQFAPWLSQLEDDLAAKKNELGMAFAGSVDNITEQGRIAEAEYTKMIGESVLGFMKEQNLINQQTFDNMLKIIGRHDDRQDRHFDEGMAERGMNIQESDLEIRQDASLMDKAKTESSLFGSVQSDDVNEFFGFPKGTKSITIDGRKMDLEELYYEQSEKQRLIGNAWKEIETMGGVITDRTAQELGLPKGMNSADMRKHLEQLEYSYWSTGEQIAAQRYATDKNFEANMEALKEERRQFGISHELQSNKHELEKRALELSRQGDNGLQEALQMWEVTGIAPKNKTLQEYGVSAGAPYPYEGNLSQAQQVEKDRNAVASLRKQYGLTELEAQAYYAVARGVTTQQAAKIMIANKDNLIADIGKESYNRIWKQVGFDSAGYADPPASSSVGSTTQTSGGRTTGGASRSF